MSVFGVAAGIAALISLLALLVKYPLRKLGMHKLNAFFMKLHEAASGLFFVAAVAHMISGLREARKNPIAALTGLAAFVISTVLIVACHMTKGTEENAMAPDIFPVPDSDRSRSCDCRGGFEEKLKKSAIYA